MGDINKIKGGITVFCSARIEDGEDYQKCRLFLMDLLKKYPDRPIITGGGPGLMNLANKLAQEHGNISVGVTIDIPDETNNAHLDVHYHAATFGERINIMLDRSDALICMPGGCGTLHELFTARTRMKTRRMRKVATYLFDSSFWDGLIDFERMAKRGTISHDDAHKHIKIINSVDKINIKD